MVVEKAQYAPIELKGRKAQFRLFHFIPHRNAKKHGGEEYIEFFDAFPGLTQEQKMVLRKHR